MPDYLSLSDVGKRLGIPVHRLYYDELKGNLVTLNLAGHKVVSQAEFDRYRRKASVKTILKTPSEYCRTHNISRSTFNYRVSKGDIGVVRVGSRIFVRKG